MKSSAPSTVKNPSSVQKAVKRCWIRSTPVEKPMELHTDMHLTLEPSCVSGNDVLTVEHLSKAFPPQILFQDVSFEIKRGEHVAIIGDNGTGKTTILKILNQVLKADSGTFTSRF